MSADFVVVIDSGLSICNALASALRNSPEVADDFYDLDASVEALEADQDARAVMIEARQWVGNILYSDEPTSLRSLRLACGMSQKDVAREMGTTQAVVSRWESGGVDMRATTMTRIADVLGVSKEIICTAICNGMEPEEVGNG